MTKESKKETAKVKVGVKAVIERDSKYLLVQENENPVKGLWGFPGGEVDVGDTIEEATIREAREETGYDVELVRKLGIWHEGLDRKVKHVFEAKIVGGELNYPKDEIMDARWFSPEEIKNMKDKLRYDWLLEAISIIEG